MRGLYCVYRFVCDCPRFCFWVNLFTELGEGVGVICCYLRRVADSSESKEFSEIILVLDGVLQHLEVCFDHLARYVMPDQLVGTAEQSPQYLWADAVKRLVCAKRIKHPGKVLGFNSLDAHALSVVDCNQLFTIRVFVGGDILPPFENIDIRDNAASDRQSLVNIR